ncbi:hypothetical protein GCK32_016021 [Trichostrongylus colubriformis]|uniref:Uncharacterized protein n=1 Tax=Trichostrongylus colubriformis TaxID=6319 RepID=A0AAN8FR64_TRICO
MNESAGQYILLRLGNLSEEALTDTIGIHGSSSIIVGVAYITLSLTLLSIYVSFNAVLMRDREFSTLQAHRLMLFVGILDCIQLLGHVFGGVATMWKNINYDTPYLCQFIGGTLNAAWVGLFPLSLLIAVQRFLIVRGKVKADEKFSLGMKVVIFLCFAYCTGFWICLLCVGKVVYFPDSFSWSYGDDGGSKILSDLEFIISMSCIAVTFIVYTAISITLYKETRGIKRVCRSEIQLFLQASVMFLILTSLISLWHFYYLILPDTVWTVFSINVYWILYCGLNPIVYIIFSKCVRILGVHHDAVYHDAHPVVG